MDISLNIEVLTITFSTGNIKNHMRGTVSHIFYLRLDFYFTAKNGSLFVNFLNIIV